MRILTVLFILQWILILFIAIFSYRKYLKNKALESELRKEQKSAASKNVIRTDFDSFYELLVKKKIMGISYISKRFDLNTETALSWAKILEQQELAKIEYPPLSEPRVRILKEVPDEGN